MDRVDRVIIGILILSLSGLIAIEHHRIDTLSCLTERARIDHLARQIGTLAVCVLGTERCLIQFGEHLLNLDAEIDRLQERNQIDSIDSTHIHNWPFRQSGPIRPRPPNDPMWHPNRVYKVPNRDWPEPDTIGRHRVILDTLIYYLPGHRLKVVPNQTRRSHENRALPL